MAQIYDLLIIGSGPAGMAAAIYAQRAGLKAAVLEKTGISGGQVLTTYEVDNYPGLPEISGFDLSEKFKEHALRLGAEIRTAEVKNIIDQGATKVLETDQGCLEARTVLIATGAHHAKLHIPGEEELAGMGVSYCATCDGAFFRNRTLLLSVAVMWLWKMRSFWRASVKRFIWCTEETACVQQSSCRNICFLFPMWK